MFDDLFFLDVHFFFFFFFSSRRRHTISLCDWSSDVCSSDLWKIWLGHRDRLHPIPVSIAASDSCSLDGSASDVADPGGQAKFSIQMRQPGLCTVKASGPAGFTTAVYRVYSFASPVSMTIVSGDDQVSSGEDFPIPLTVRVAGANGPQPNVPVQFETAAGAFLGGVTSLHGRTSTVLTDANGDAAVVLGLAPAFPRPPSKLKVFGPENVNAFIPGTPGTQVSFTETVDCRRLDSPATLSLIRH